SSVNQQKAPAKKKTVQQSSKMQTSQGSSLKRLKIIHDYSDDEFNGGEYNDGNHDNDGGNVGNDNPIPKSPNSLADNNAMSPTFDLTVTRRLSGRLDSLE
uniref:Uncharacterized protein n=1 Tax=Clytia hemisphaerica TaxID=252671 RepID=A0A7M5X5Y8_9CNID